MQSQTVFFTGTIDPTTGEIRSRRIDTRRELPPSDLMVDVHYSPDVRHVEIPNNDPTLAQFYEPRQENERNEAH